MKCKAEDEKEVMTQNVIGKHECITLNPNRSPPLMTSTLRSGTGGIHLNLSLQDDLLELWQRTLFLKNRYLASLNMV